MRNGSLALTSVPPDVPKLSTWGFPEGCAEMGGIGRGQPITVSCFPFLLFLTLRSLFVLSITKVSYCTYISFFNLVRTQKVHVNSCSKGAHLFLPFFATLLLVFDTERSVLAPPPPIVKACAVAILDDFVKDLGVCCVSGPRVSAQAIQ